MPAHDGETTDQALLARLGDWADDRAWSEFVRQYDPWIRQHGQRFRFDPETIEELSQRIWVELARRMRTYRYDPGRRFRHWLTRLCRSRAVDLWRQRQNEARHRAGSVHTCEPTAPARVLDVLDTRVPQDALLQRARRVQAAVRQRVDDQTWRVFWSIAVEGQSVRQTADTFGLSYAAAFAAQKRVVRMLREENARLYDRPAASEETRTASAVETGR